MKKLEKLRLHDVAKICDEDQRSIIGGNGPDSWEFRQGPDGNMYYCPGDVYVYGSAPGYCTNISSMNDAMQINQNYHDHLQSGGYFFEFLGILTGSGVALGGGLSLQMQSDYRSDDAAQLSKAISALGQMGYTDASTVRYSNLNGVIKVWDIESGQLLYSSDDN